MAVSADKIIPGVLPPKEETKGVDFLSILDSFDPASLSASQLEQFKAWDPYLTGYRKKQSTLEFYSYGGTLYPIPEESMEEKLGFSRGSAKRDRDDLIAREKGYKEKRVNAYAKARAALVRAIGSKVVAYIVYAEYQAMTPEERWKRLEDSLRWEAYCNEGGGIELPYGFIDNPNYRSDSVFISILAVKTAAVRKQLKINQRNFAKTIGVNINKYGDYERGNLDLADLGLLSYEFIKRVVDATYANPYWLEDKEDYTLDADEEKTAETVEDALEDDPYPMFVTANVIRHWWSSRK